MHNVYTILGAVICPLLLGAGSLLSIVSMNWHRSSGESALIPFIWIVALVFRIIRPRYFRIAIILVADIGLLYFILGELFHYRLPELSSYLISSGGFWFSLLLLVVLISDWIFLFRAAKNSVHKPTV